MAAAVGCGTRSSPATLADVEPIKEVFAPTGTIDPHHFGKVAVVQWAPMASTPLGVSRDDAETFKQGLRTTLAGYVREAATGGAELVITPEFGTVGYPDIPELPSEEDDYRNRDDIAPYVEAVPGPTTAYFSKLASELHVWIHVGLAEVDPATDKYYNTVVVLDASGRIVTKFRKLNLYQLEDKFLSVGEGPVTYDGPFGKVGLAICADIYSSNPMSKYRDAHANVVALSTSWAVYNSGFSAFTSAAITNQVYVLAANQTYFPDSGVITPTGEAQSHIRQSTGVAYGYLPYATRH
jgi:predicted amidohydrolase